MLTIKDHKIRTEIFDNPIIGRHLKGMRLYGYIIGNDQGYQLWHFVRCSCYTLTFLASCFLIIVKVSRDLDNLSSDATSRATAVLFCATSFAVLNAYLQRKRVVTLINFIHEDMHKILSCPDHEEDNILRKTIKYCRLGTNMLLIPAVVAGSLACLDCYYRTIFFPDTVFNVPQILNRTAQPIMLFRVFPFGEVYDNFIIGYIGPSFEIILAMFTVPVWHTFVACLMNFLIYKINIINKRLQDMDLSKINPKLRTREDIERLEEDEKTYWLLKMCEYCVNEQIKIRWFAKELEKLIGIPVFVDFIIFSLVFCFLFYSLTFGHYTKMDCCFLILYLFVIATISWIYHWHATLVTDSNDQMRFAIYSCDWYNYPVKVQKSIRLLMMESSTPLILRAIYVDLKLSTFLDVIRGAYSYFSILRNSNVN